MANETQTLEIKIKYSDGGAGNKLQAIADNVERLNAAADGPGLRNITTIGNSLKELGESAYKIKQIGPAFSSLSESARTLLSTFKSFRLSNYTAGIAGMKTALEGAGQSFGAFNKQAGGISRVATAIGKLPDALSAFGEKDYSAKIQNTSTTLDGLAKASERVAKRGTGLMNFAYGLKELPSALQAFDKASTKTMTGGIFGKGAVGNVGKVLQGLSDSLKDVNTKAFSSVGKLAEGLKTLSKLAQDSNLATNLQTVAQQIAAFANTVSSNVSEDVLKRIERLSNAISGMRAGFGGGAMANLSGGAKQASVSFRDLSKGMKTVISLAEKISKLPLKMILSPIAGIGKGLSEMTGKFTNFLRRIGNVALYRAVRTGIKMVTSAVKEGVNNLYLWSEQVGNSFEQTMDSLATSFLYLKNSIGAMVSPILDVLAPAIEVIVEQAVSVINIINQVIATLTGATTWRRAIRSAADYSDNISGLGHDAEDANDAVKELKRTILGFDEINRLEDKTKTTQKAKAGKDPTGYYANTGAFSFEELPITQSALDIAEKIKKAWEKADFTEIGDLIGQKLGDALLRVPWEQKIQPAVVKIAKSLGTLLNGLLDYNGKGGKAMWDGIAYTIYNAINTAVLGYTTFFDTVHWEGIGEGVGAALKQVLENINWYEGDNSVAAALAAFPNAVIDAFTGFTKRFTTQDFYTAGQNIGKTVSSALTQINWTGLFGNAVKIATGVLAALNGALEGFDWAGVKDAILTGIQNIPAQQWSTLGSEIGLLAFNVIDFVGNLVSTLVAMLKKGKWEQLINGIWSGFNEGIKKSYGSWAGAAKALGDWIGDNLGTISILVAFVVGGLTLKALAANFASMLMTKIGLAQVPGTGMALGAWVKALEITGGIALTISGIETVAKAGLETDMKKKLMSTVRGVVEGALGGALVGFGLASKLGITGLAGGAWGLAIGAGLTLAIGTLISAVKKEGVNSDEFIFDLAGGIAGAVVGLALTGNPVGGVIGFSVGVILTLSIKKIIPKLIEGADSLLFGWFDNLIGNDRSNTNHGLGDDYYASLDALNGGGTNTSTQNRTYGAGITKENGKNYWSETVYIKTEPDTSKSSSWFSTVSKAWDDSIKGKNVKGFTSEGLVANASKWNSQLNKGWSNVISKNVPAFKTEGLNAETSKYKGQLSSSWQSVISTEYPSFKTVGLNAETSKYRNQLSTSWNSVISREFSSFRTAGVKDESGTWWNQTEGFWASVADYSKLSASVEIGNSYNAFVDAFNSIQTYFNEHTIYAKVEAQATGVQNVANAISNSSSNTSSYTQTSNDAPLDVGEVGTNSADKIAKALGYSSSSTTKKKKKTKKKANGGIYKNGEWHSISQFAVGGLPNSGEMFIARESGPELVGAIGNSTAVLNNEQIVSSVAAGVAQAVAQVMGNGQTNEVVVKVDSETLYRAVKKGERKASGRYSTSVAVG